MRQFLILCGLILANGISAQYFRATDTLFQNASRGDTAALHLLLNRNAAQPYRNPEALWTYNNPADDPIDLFFVNDKKWELKSLLKDPDKFWKTWADQLVFDPMLQLYRLKNDPGFESKLQEYDLPPRPVLFRWLIEENKQDLKKNTYESLFEAEALQVPGTDSLLWQVFIEPALAQIQPVTITMLNGNKTDGFQQQQIRRIYDSNLINNLIDFVCLFPEKKWRDKLLSLQDTNAMACTQHALAKLCIQAPAKSDSCNLNCRMQKWREQPEEAWIHPNDLLQQLRDNLAQQGVDSFQTVIRFISRTGNESPLLHDLQNCHDPDALLLLALLDYASGKTYWKNESCNLTPEPASKWQTILFLQTGIHLIPANETINEVPAAAVFCYWRNHWRDYRWNNEHQRFENFVEHPAPPQKSDSLMSIIRFNPDIASQRNAYWSLLHLPDNRETRACLRQIEKTDSWKKTFLPLFPEDAVEPLHRYCLFLDRTKISSQPGGISGAMIDSLRQDLIGSADEAAFDERIYTQLNEKNIHAFELQLTGIEADFFPGNPYASVDRWYACHFDEIIQHPNELRLYLKKSAIFRQLGIVGSCNYYRMRFRGKLSAKPALLLCMLSKDKDIRREAALAFIGIYGRNTDDDTPLPFVLRNDRRPFFMSSQLRRAARHASPVSRMSKYDNLMYETRMKTRVLNDPDLRRKVIDAYSGCDSQSLGASQRGRLQWLRHCELPLGEQMKAMSLYPDSAARLEWAEEIIFTCPFGKAAELIRNRHYEPGMKHSYIAQHIIENFGLWLPDESDASYDTLLKRLEDLPPRDFAIQNLKACGIENIADAKGKADYRRIETLLQFSPSIGFTGTDSQTMISTALIRFLEADQQTTLHFSDNMQMTDSIFYFGAESRVSAWINYLHRHGLSHEHYQSKPVWR